jgi:hypothetical protein
MATVPPSIYTVVSVYGYEMVKPKRTLHPLPPPLNMLGGLELEGSDDNLVLCRFSRISRIGDGRMRMRTMVYSCNRKVYSFASFSSASFGHDRLVILMEQHC